MKAPNKLYVDTKNRLSDSILYGFTQKRKENDIEYVRKDVFIDKWADIKGFGDRKSAENLLN